MREQQCVLRRNYFLNKLSNAARASFALRGAGITPFAGECETVPEGAESRATVTRGLNNSHVFAWSFNAMRTGMGFTHWKRVEESKFTHCLQQCKAAPHFGHLPVKSISGAKATAQLKQRAAATFCTNRGSLGPVTSIGSLGPDGRGLSER